MKPKSPRRNSTPGSGSLCPKLSFDWRCQNSAKLFSLPGFIGFPGLGADGLTRFHGPGSELSPMFTDLSARSCIDRRRRQKSPVSVYGRRTAMVQHITERKRGQQLSAPTQSDGWDGLHGTFREGQITPKIPSNKGLQLAISPRTIREVQYSRLSETALLSADSCLRSAVQGRNPKASVPGWAKLSSLRQLAVSPNSRAEP